jgi:hypothetical protein
MALSKIVLVSAFVVGAQAFASSRVDDALTFNASPKKSDKAKATKNTRMFDALNNGASDVQKTELPKNARHDATAGVFI